jgi:hypothetical protein
LEERAIAVVVHAPHGLAARIEAARTDVRLAGMAVGGVVEPSWLSAYLVPPEPDDVQGSLDMELAVALLSVIVFPLLGLSLLRRQEQIESGHAPPRLPMPTPATPVLSVAGRELSAVGKATVEAAT